MVLILILIGGDYILFIIGGVVLLCFKHFGPIQNHNPCATCKILSFMPKDSPDAQPVQYKKSFQAFLIKAIIFGSGPRAVRYTVLSLVLRLHINTGHFLPHLSRLPCLPDAPHLHVNRP